MGSFYFCSAPNKPIYISATHGGLKSAYPWSCRTNLMTNVLWLHPSRYRMNYVTMVFKISQKLCIYRRQIQHGGFQLNSNSSENIPRKPVSRCVLPQYPNFTILDAVTWHGFQFLYRLQLFFLYLPTQFKYPVMGGCFGQRPRKVSCNLCEGKITTKGNEQAGKRRCESPWIWNCFSVCPPQVRLGRAEDKNEKKFTDFHIPFSKSDHQSSKIQSPA